MMHIHVTNTGQEQCQLAGESGFLQ